MYIGFLEDEPELSQHVCEILESAGHSVALFNNGQDMIRAIGRDTMDLFVLDWRVPRVTGIEVLKHIRLVKGLKEPVLFLTSKSDEQDLLERDGWIHLVLSNQLHYSALAIKPLQRELVVHTRKHDVVVASFYGTVNKQCIAWKNASINH